MITKHASIVGRLARNVLRPCYFGFVEGHHYLSESQHERVKTSVAAKNATDIVHAYEDSFAGLVGNGKATSFASARMAFYTFLKQMGIGTGHEVILPAFTCSVMVNAVYRAGAQPVFVDIDESTLGSDAAEIERKISARTRLVVAQHSFGIPCDIAPIAELATKKGLILVEDCAITFDSSYRGVKVGNWGDAAIFSTDHSKPINTLIGGMLYTKDRSLHEKIRATSSTIPDLDDGHQRRLYEQFLYESEYYVPERYGRALALNYVRRIRQKLRGKPAPPVFLDSDVRRDVVLNSGYPYPARMPASLAQVGLFELERWSEERSRRKKLLESLLGLVREMSFDQYLPSAYFSKERELVPFRFVFTHPDNDQLLRKMSKHVDVSWTWFRSPIVYCPDGPESMGYVSGSCRKAEQITKSILNWPTAFPGKWEDKNLEILREMLRDSLNRAHRQLEVKKLFNHQD
jgi:dTDP-4-amino-4,6-dideoxygalactose transaminase